MRLPENHNRLRIQFKQERKQWRRRYFKKAARKKDRGYRLLWAVFLAGVVLYLTAAGCFRDLFLNVREENTIELRKEGRDREEESFLQELYKITFRLKTGEVIFYHEKTGADAAEDARGDLMP